MIRLKLKFFVFLSVLFLSSCSKEDQDNFADTPYIEPALKVFYSEDLRNIPLTKSYVFEKTDKNTQYAYMDLIRLSNGNLLMTSMSDQTIEDFKPGNIIIAESVDDGQTWSEPRIMTQEVEGEINSSLPSLLQLGNQHLLLIFGIKYSSQHIDIASKESLDNGRTWSKLKIIGEDKTYQMLNNSRALYHNGRIILPVSIPKKSDIMFSLNNVGSFYYYSDDKGKSWKKSQILSNRMALFEPGITALTDNELLMNIRTNLGSILFARSHDKGASWTFEGSNIKSPSSPQKIARIPGTDSLLMVWNHTDYMANQHGANRSPLSLAISTDRGKSWKRILDLETSPGYISDYAYPAILIENDTIFIAYNERNNAYSTFSLKLLKLKRKDLAND